MKSKEAGFCLTMRRISRLFVNTFISCTNHLSGRFIYLRLCPFFPRLDSHNVRTNLLSQIFPPLTQCSNLLSLLSTQCTNHLIHFSFQSRNVRTTFHFNFKKKKNPPGWELGSNLENTSETTPPPLPPSVTTKTHNYVCDDDDDDNNNGEKRQDSGHTKSVSSY